MGEVIKKTHNGKFIGWYLRYVDSDGKRKQRASHRDTFLEAKAALAQIEARVAKERTGIKENAPIEPTFDLTVAALIDRFLSDYSEPTIKDRTRYLKNAASVLRRIERAAPQLCKITLRELSSQHVTRLRDTLSRHHEPGTVRTTLFQLGSVFSWAVRQGLLQGNPVKPVTPPRAAPPSEEWLQPAEVRRLLDVARRFGEERGDLWKTRHVAIALGVFLGLRLGEIYGLRWRDVDFKTGRVTVARSYDALPKSGRSRHLKMPAELRSILEKWQPICPPTTEAVVIPVCRYGRWQMSNCKAAHRGLHTLFKAAQLPPFKRPWHSLRHTFATNYLREGGSIAALQKLLGHVSIATTMIYSHMAADHLDAEMARVKY